MHCKGMNRSQHKTQTSCSPHPAHKPPGKACRLCILSVAMTDRRTLSDKRGRLRNCDALQVVTAASIRQEPSTLVKPYCSVHTGRAHRSSQQHAAALQIAAVGYCNQGCALLVRYDAHRTRHTSATSHQKMCGLLTCLSHHQHCLIKGP
jgi:hypothetical protein